MTQAFNTTNSMGRLTLNVLLSFAQFEREVTGERIRDKIAASKRKGMWMGGSVPIIDRALWDMVQARLSGTAPRPRTGNVSVLADRLFDAQGKRLNTAHGRKGSRRYRYYVSSTLKNQKGWRLPAGDVEAMVQQSLARFLAPNITLAIIEGRQPVEPAARTLLRFGELPICWEAQRKALGFV